VSTLLSPASFSRYLHKNKAIILVHRSNIA
jgi:hypothetical protein